MPIAILFDDARASLAPLTDLRPTFHVRTGALTNHQRIASILDGMAGIDVAGLWTEDALAPLVRDRTDMPANDPAVLDAADSVLLVNGRAVLTPQEAPTLEVGRAVVDAASGAIIAVHLDPAAARRFLDDRTLPSGIDRVENSDGVLLERPWDVVRLRDDALDIDLAILSRNPSVELPPGVVGIEDERVSIDPQATVYPTAVLDASGGPIHIAAGATVRPCAVLIGPCAVGQGSTVLDGAVIRPHTAIGPVCKVNGEVSGVIFQGFANKGHDGFVGDTWIGEWVNLGAGTITSNLLNTYTEVAVQTGLDARREKTGLLFFGSLVGDHTKTAIGTRLMTGSIFSTGTMIATTAPPPTFTDRFAWLTDARYQRYRINKFIETARTVMGRRGIEPSDAYIKRLEELYAMTPQGTEA